MTYATHLEAMAAAIDKIEALEDAQLLRESDPSSVARAAAYGEAVGIMQDFLALVAAPSADPQSLALAEKIVAQTAEREGEDPRQWAERLAATMEPKPAPVADAGLRECPWCGHPPKIEATVPDPVITTWLIECERCGVLMYPLGNPKQMAIDYWNTRAPRPSLADDPAAVGRCAESIRRAWHNPDLTIYRDIAIAALRAAEGAT